MADVTQRIVVEVDYKSFGSDKVIEEMVSLGKITEADKKHYENLAKEIQNGIIEALREMGLSLDDLKNKNKPVDDGFKSLKQRLRDAREEAQILAQKFGDTSKEAVAAQKRVANLSDELGDFNDRVKSLNPDAKFNAFNNVMQGTIGAFQGVTGAMQLFGSENKELNETLQKMQGLLNLTQGINSLTGLKDAFANLRVVLGLVTVAEEGVAVSTGTMSAAMSATGVGALVVGLGALVYWLTKSEQSMEELTNATDEWAKSMSGEKYDYNKAIREQILKQQELLGILTKNQVELARLDQKRVDNIADLDKQTASAIAKIWELRKSGEIKSEQEAFNRIIKIRNDAKDVKLKIDQLYTLERNNILLQADKDADKKEVERHKEKVKKKVDEEMKIIRHNNPIGPIEFKAPDLKDAIGPIDEWQKYHDEALNAQMERLKWYYGQSAALASEALNFAQQQSQGSLQAEEAALNDQLKRKEISQKQYDQKLRALKRKQAEDDKKYAIFQSLIQASQAIINALTQQNPVAAVAFASALSALQIAAIISRPVPKFAKGTLNVQGGVHGQDSVHAMLMPGEAVIPTSINRAYSKTIEAIYKGTVRPSDINAFVESHKSGKNSGQSMAQSMELLRAVRGNGNVGIRNASELAKLIGQEVRSSFNPRRQW